MIKAAAARIVHYANSTKDPEDKVISWQKAKSLLLEVNGVLSNYQITFILRELHNTGHVSETVNIATYVYVIVVSSCSEIMGNLYCSI